eukprot:GILK01000536.1.p1 GENE.GILK01000536.1~~GILK01000536.1.p1  ORF type:complete len:426 (-),score=79.52 GILK01000536.1:323-1411(-)
MPAYGWGQSPMPYGTGVAPQNMFAPSGSIYGTAPAACETPMMQEVVIPSTASDTLYVKKQDGSISTFIDESTRKMRHKEIEVKRRVKLNDCIMRMKKLTNCRKSDKNSVLAETLNTLESLTAECDKLKQSNTDLHRQLTDLRSKQVKEEHFDHHSDVSSPSFEHMYMHSPQSVAVSPVYTPDMECFQSAPVQTAPAPIDYSAAVLQSPVPMAVIGMDGVFLECSAAFADTLGYPKDKLKHVRTMFSTLTPSDLPKLYAGIQALVCQTKNTVVDNAEFVSSNGNIVSATRSLSLSRTANGIPQYIICTLLPAIPTLKMESPVPTSAPSFVPLIPMEDLIQDPLQVQTEFFDTCTLDDLLSFDF